MIYFELVIIQKVNETHLESKVAAGKTKLPQAGNMAKLTWSDSLANRAFEHAKTCVFAHSSTGQNLAQGTLAKDTTAVELWFAEISHMATSDVSAFRSAKLQQIGHFTQIAWANTKTVI